MLYRFDGDDVITSDVEYLELTENRNDDDIDDAGDLIPI